MSNTNSMTRSQTKRQGSGFRQSTDGDDDLTRNMSDLQVKSESEQQLVGRNDPVAIELRTLSLQHPLREKWVFWYHNKAVSEDWLQCLLPICTVTTLEEFWRVFLQMNPPTLIVQNREVYLFRDGIQPQWEDVRNKDGGRWTIQTQPNEVDDQWTNLCMALIGEQFDIRFCDDVCGAVMHKKRNQYKFSIWTSTYENEESAKSIGSTFKELLCSERSILYDKHKTSSKDVKMYKV
jgi:translation initiation factor 4E